MIGRGSVIGGNVWLTQSIEPGSRVVAEPPRNGVSPRRVDGCPSSSPGRSTRRVTTESERGTRPARRRPRRGARADARALAGVERVVAVMSGKGGVGKSAVAVNIAAALAQGGRRVGLLDADLHGPSVAKMLGLRGQPVRIGSDERLRPVPGPAGLAVQSMDFFLQGEQALDWEGPDGEGATWRSALEQAALADLIGRTDWGALDCLVIDLAPGSDRLPALAVWPSAPSRWRSRFRPRWPCSRSSARCGAHSRRACR